MKKVFAVICLLVICMASNGWAGMATEIWTRTYDSTNDHNDGSTTFTDIGRSVAIDSAGKLIAAGYIAGPLNYKFSGHARKYDRHGNLVCTVTVETGAVGSLPDLADSWDIFNAVAVDSQDNFVIVGTKAGPWPPAQMRVYVQKYDPDCNPLWPTAVEYIGNPTSYGSSAWNSGFGVAIDKNDNIYVAGGIFWEWGIEGMFTILKYDTDGVLQTSFPWTYYDPNNGSLQDCAFGIAVDSQDNVIAVGRTASSTANYDWHVRKYSPTGTLLWKDIYSGSYGGVDFAWKVDVDSNDDVLVAGQTQVSSTAYDWLVIKYSKDGVAGEGQRLWTRTYHMASGKSAVANDVAVAQDDNVLVAGYAYDETDISHRRIELLSGTDLSLIAEKIWPAVATEVLAGIATRSDVLATAGNINVGTNDNDIVTTVLS